MDVIIALLLLGVSVFLFVFGWTAIVAIVAIIVGGILALFGKCAPK